MTVLLAGQIRKADRLDVCSEFLYCVLSLSTLAGCVHDRYPFVSQKGNSYACVSTSKSPNHVVMATVVGTHDNVWEHEC